MENEHYYNIYNYLLSQQVPEYFTPLQKQQLINQSKIYCIENDLLYKQDRKNLEKLY